MRLVLLLLILLPFSAHAKSLRCDQIDSFLSIGEQFHLTNPFISQELIEKAGELYLDSLDPQLSFLSQEEYDEQIKLLKKNSAKKLNQYYTDPCLMFTSMEKKAMDGEKRLDKAISGALKLGPHKYKKASGIEKRLSNKNLIRYVYKKIRNDLYVAKKEGRTKLIEKLSNPQSMFKDYQERRAGSITKAFYRAYDPHSEYYVESENRQLDNSISASMVGIGIIFELEKKGALINKVLNNSPISRTEQIFAGDYITAVNGTKVSSKDLEQFSNLLSVPEGTNIVLDILKKDGSEIKVPVSLGRIELEDSKVSYKVFKVKGKNIVSIKVPSFYYDDNVKSGSAKDTYKAFAKAWSENSEKIDLVILDLRFNTGGLVSEALEMTGLFVGNKVVMQTKSHNEVAQLNSIGTQMLISEPLVVLTNKLSASASEIVAGALKDYNRGLIVGEKTTFGKGTMQSIIPNTRSAQLGTIKVTTAQFYLPKGSSTQIKGVPSDIILPSPLDTSKNNEAEAKNALSWDKVESVVDESDDFKLNQVNLKKLIQLSSNRVKKVKGFKDFKDKKKSEKFMQNMENIKQDIILDEAINISTDYLGMIPK